MSLSMTYNVYFGILLITLAGFVAAPAWSRWTRNLMLVRRGVRVTGHYQGRFRVAFHPPSGKKVLFSTWSWPIWRHSLGDELPVLYDPTDPSRAEVMQAESLWGSPLNNLTWAASLVFQAVLLFLGTNFGIALLLALGADFVCYSLAMLVLRQLYPASRLQQIHRANTAHQLAPHPHPPEKKEQPAEPQPEPAELPPAESTPAAVKPPKPYRARGQAARAQLLRDMIDIPADLGEEETW